MRGLHAGSPAKMATGTVVSRHLPLFLYVRLGRGRIENCLAISRKQDFGLVVAGRGFGLCMREGLVRSRATDCELERETRFELATLALARRCSTTELFPLTHSQHEGWNSTGRERDCQAAATFP